MRLVVADASPLHYLILVDVADILSHLFETVHIPVEVRDELTCEAAPPDVRTWMQRSPRWIETLPVPSLAFSDPSLRSLGPGERAAIALAKSIAADLLLIDDRAGASAAQRAGFAVTGTFGVLDLASRAGCSTCGPSSNACRRPTSDTRRL